MPVSSHKFQAPPRSPKGTRDFYPPEMAVRRYLEGVWREVSISHGFEEVDGPTFEHLDLYTAKSGPGIVSEIFGVFSGKDEKELEELKRTGQSPFALRPEFTPTLARMVAARAAQLPKPIKWFCMPNFFRAERPQRGRLREFFQWNVDVLGDDSPQADAEVIAVAVGVLDRLGLSPDDVVVKVSHRGFMSEMLLTCGVSEDRLDDWFAWVDAYNKRTVEERITAAQSFGATQDEVGAVEAVLLRNYEFETADASVDILPERHPGAVPARRSKRSIERAVRPGFDRYNELKSSLQSLQIAEWCALDFWIVRGLAYYTGTVFEIHETTGKERAIAGGGRYDKLVELFGGPSTPAVGFAMGDVVIRLVLEERGLLKPAEEYLPRPDAFVIAAADDGAARLPSLVALLRRERLHVRHSYKTTRNVGKLLTEASKVRARFAVILGQELAENAVALKDLDSGEQRLVPLDALARQLREGAAAQRATP